MERSGDRGWTWLHSNVPALDALKHILKNRTVKFLLGFRYLVTIKKVLKSISPPENMFSTQWSHRGLAGTTAVRGPLSATRSPFRGSALPPPGPRGDLLRGTRDQNAECAPSLGGSWVPAAPQAAPLPSCDSGSSSTAGMTILSEARGDHAPLCTDRLSPAPHAYANARATAFGDGPSGGQQVR